MNTQAPGFNRLGLIAGGGALPRHVAEAAAAEGRLGAVIAIRGFARVSDFAFLDGVPVSERGVGEVGGSLEDLRRNACDAVCFAGIVERPDFATLKPDWRGARALPGAVAAAMKGDDSLLRYVLGLFEKEGLAVVGADAAADALLARPGLIGGPEPDATARADIDRALNIAAEIGKLDIGQGAVVCEGLVLAVEAQEGTDAMLARVALLPEAVRGRAEARRGVLAKRPKPVQDRRVDLPVIGVSTVENAARAGLAGVVAPAGGALILGEEAVAQAAGRHGVFVLVTEKDDDE